VTAGGAAAGAGIAGLVRDVVANGRRGGVGNGRRVARGIGDAVRLFEGDAIGGAQIAEDGFIAAGQRAAGSRPVSRPEMGAEG